MQCGVMAGLVPVDVGDPLKTTSTDSARHATSRLTP